MPSALHRELAWLQLRVAAEITRTGQPDAGPACIEEDLRRQLLAQLTGELDAPLSRQALLIRADDVHRTSLGVPAADPADGLGQLAATFALDERERDLLVVAAAPELDSRFGYLYGVVLGDPARRAASLELAQRLLAADGDEEWELRDRLDPHARLRRSGLVRADGAGPFPFRPLRMPENIVHQLATGQADLDTALSGCAWLDPPATTDLEALDSAAVDTLRRAAALWSATEPGKRPVIQINAPRGAALDEALAALSDLTGRPRISLDLACAINDPLRPEEIAAVVSRDARACQAILVLISGEPGPSAEVPDVMLSRLAEAPSVPTVLVRRAGPSLPRPPLAVCIDLEPATTAVRFRLWRSALDAAAIPADARTVRDLAATFVLDPAQLANAAERAAVQRRLHPQDRTLTTLRAAAASGSAHNLDTVGRRITPAAGWPDLVVPAPVRTQLQELAAAARGRRLVLDEWGLSRRVRARGVTALFTGGSGTGKTTAAEVLAADLGIDLYVIDLATVISKWIGETEKNLRRVFSAADSANAVLLFDEADALFGRRSEIKDAHDRYANTEVAYLLQLMDTVDGVTILATNLATNLDPAFLRRLQFAVDFPPPDAHLRRKLWQLALPATVPARDLDLDFAAQHFELTGGDIRNAALHAASLAAADGAVVTMPLLVRSVVREYQKRHRVPPPADFGPWQDEVARLSTGDPVGV
ncbi:ATP-binding protein [Actinoplanes awajinensis]|uniref:AAA+ ATPase domain-containing protein n=1 Tax=Actinoplanes awajinensis subsp. mycoplanecinus TaxID=135947 RepID=A0A101JEX2_9ACTN|nr:ATP-binding protein [Actinoplanes awajinensis]KUL25588.1 hypothetical protein ADL15_40295 [Actinoplanes awajinensis subsp. mycoplanecinus]